MSNEELARLLQNLIRIGNVIDIIYRHPARVRVKTGNLETTWLQWREIRAGRSRTWNPPTLGEQVVILSPGGDLTGGIVFPALNSDATPPPSDSPDETVTEFPDGTIVSHNHVSGASKLTGAKTFFVETTEKITLKTAEIILDADKTTSTGEHTIEGLLSYLAGMSGEGGADGIATVIRGDVTHDGGNFSSNGIVLHLHIHPGVMKGGDNTEKPA